MPVVPPPAAPGYMLSLLKRKLAASGTIFGTSGPEYWLVWEPGKWSASSGFDPTQAPKGPGGVIEAATPDSLAFQLKERVPLRLGRAAACDIVINDGTVSREHLRFEPSASGGWKVVVVSAGSSTEVDGAAIPSGQAVELTSGTL